MSEVENSRALKTDARVDTRVDTRSEENHKSTIISKLISREIFPYAVIAIAMLLLVVRARYSFCWSDESFYFATSNRFLQGDAIFVHDWFPTQMISLILLPFHIVFKMINGSNQGVILYFRIVYVLVSGMIAMLIYRLISKKRPMLTALCCALFYLFYAHLNIATMSYYTMSMTMFLLSFLLLYSADLKLLSDLSKLDIKKNKCYIILSGVCFALAVVSLPTLVVFYALCVLAVIVAGIKWKWIYKAFGLHFAGIMIPAVFSLIYLQCTTTLSGFIYNLHFVLSDEEHQTSLLYPFKNFFLAVFDVFSRKMVVAVVLLFVVSLVIFWLLKVFPPSIAKAVTSEIAKFLPALITLADLMLFMFFMIKAFGHTGFTGTVLVLLALPLIFLQLNPDLKLFFMLIGGGLIFSMTYSYSSMCDLYVLSIGHNIAAIGAICLISDFIVELKQRIDVSFKKFIFAVCVMCLLISITHVIYLRFVNVYRDAPVSQLTAVIEEGPAKGLYTTPEHKASYDEILAVISAYEDKGSSVFFTKLLPWGYLATDMECGAPTTWRTKLSSERLGLYYQEHPEKVPDVVVVLEDAAGSYKTCGDVVDDPNPNENEYEGYLLSYMQEKGYTCEEVGNSVKAVYCGLK